MIVDPTATPDRRTIATQGLTQHERDALQDLMVHPDPFDLDGEGFLLTHEEATAISRVLRRDRLRADFIRTRGRIPQSAGGWR